VEGFSLYNSKDKNMRLFKDSSEYSYWIRYRVGQNKYLPVYISNTNIDLGIVICYSGDYFDLKIKENGEYFVLDSYGSIYKTDLSDQFKSFLKKKYFHSESFQIRPVFSISQINHCNQKIFSETLDQIAKGYLDYLNELTIYKYQTTFLDLEDSEQNYLISLCPLILDYDTHRLFPKPPERKK
jgi:hypothetical protein